MGALMITTLACALPAAAQPDTGAASMPALHGEAVVVDAARGTLVLVGGRTSRGWLAGTWEWDGQHWRRTETMRRRDALPAGRGGGSLVHDARNGRLLYVGGYNDSLLADLWALDARGWRQLPR